MDELTCDKDKIINNSVFFKIKHFDIDREDKTRMKEENQIKIGIITINNKKYFIKIWENIKKDTNIDLIKENKFYKNYSNKIIKDNMEKNICIPIKTLMCDNNKNLYLLFDIATKDYKYKYIVTNLNYKKWLDLTIQLCLIVFYLNHVLGFFHNDLSYYANFNNIMIQNNNKPFEINVDEYTYKIEDNYIVIIDFEHVSKEPTLMTKRFYNDENNLKNTKNINYNKYESEVFIMFYISYLNYFGKNTAEDSYDYYTIYDKFIQEMNNSNTTLKDFDKHIINSLLSLQK